MKYLVCIVFAAVVFSNGKFVVPSLNLLTNGNLLRELFVIYLGPLFRICC